MKYYRIVTLGCKVNTYESEAIANQLCENGYQKYDDNHNPDVVIINTCSVTSASDGKSRQMINREHRNYPDALIIVCGCYSQIASEVVAAIDGVKIVIGTKYRNKLIELINEYEESKKPIIRVENSRDDKEYEGINVNTYNDNTRAFIKIQDGCNNFCSYCLIPYARGPVRSRPKEEILAEAKHLADSGFKELVLTGIHTAGYGLDFKDYLFVDLLKDLLEVLPPYERVRISSIEESEIPDAMLDLLASDKRVVPHLHIPIQSGCDTVLRRMNRKYTCAQFKEMVLKLRKRIPDIALTTDVIVGFPGESEEEFKKTVDFIKDIGFSALHVFPYSRRSGTVADKMPNQIDVKIKKERVRTLIELSNKLAKEYAKKFEGKPLEILFETYDEKTGMLVGHAPNYMRVSAKGKIDYLNTIREVIIDVSGYPLNYGHLKEE